jgi:hemoglobin-like flavoprotein
VKENSKVADTNVGNIKEDIKILENWLKELNELFKNTHINNTKERKALEHILSDYKRVLKENEQLKNDIENMYDEEVVISIIEDNFNLSRNEVLEVLGSEE